MSRASPLAGLLLLLALPAWAEAPQLDNPAAFERGFAVSFYQFDACGDALAGRMFRRALTERFAACPFSAEARAHFRQRSRTEQAKARQQMQRIVEAQGGLPRALPGTDTTCREHQQRAEYRSFRALLERYAAGEAAADAVVSAACDAVDVVP